MFYRCFPISQLHRDTIRQCLGDIVTEWCSDWFGKSPSSIEISIDVDVDATQYDGRGYASINGGPLFHIDDSSLRELWLYASGQKFIGIVAEDNKYVLSSALRGLVNKLEGKSNKISDLARVDQASSDHAAWLNCKINFEKICIGILLPPEIVLGILSMGGSGPTQSKDIVDSKLDALEDSKVELVANLGQVSLSVAELGRLSIGDVLAVDALLSDDIYVATRAGEFLVKGRLGSFRDRKAIVLKSN